MGTKILPHAFQGEPLTYFTIWYIKNKTQAFQIKFTQNITWGQQYNLMAAD